jgi:hypothetical protein
MAPHVGKTVNIFHQYVSPSHFLRDTCNGGLNEERGAGAIIVDEISLLSSYTRLFSNTESNTIVSRHIHMINQPNS